MENIIKVENLSKSFGKIKAVSSVSLNIKEKELFGLIGPDGAGKTTLIRMLTTLLLPDKGKATIMNYDVEKGYRNLRNNVGYMPGQFSLYADLTIEENIKFFADLFGTSIKQNQELIEDIYQFLRPFKNRKAGKLSGGMKQKLALCCALIHAPRLLFLDEPTTGVDPTSRQEFWEMLGRLKAKGITIIVSTPYMDEAVRCDRIALMKEGKLMKIDTPQNMIKNFGTTLWQISAQNMFQLLKDVRSYEKIQQCYTFGQELHFTFQKEDVNGLIAFLNRKGHKEIELNTALISIEDCYLKLAQPNI
jgi:ABC-type multidrug transport system ATPase subunit